MNICSTLVLHSSTFKKVRMTTTTVRLPVDMKNRISHIAATTNTNAHSFILQAIADKLAITEQQAEFHASAFQRYDNILTTGKAITWADMRKYLLDRASGKVVKTPVARKLGA